MGHVSNLNRVNKQQLHKPFKNTVMKKYTPSAYFSTKNGLKIYDGERNVCVIVMGDSTNEISNLADKILAAINEPYYKQKALLDEAKENYDMGVITTDEYQQQKQKILSIQ